ncbi:NUDIX hydrolase [Actinomycetospora sp. CA-084318]|uniref:NUDIX hydrolase n=1 Tax=Actinomycetospora sp. CA-084318 TaxID=3239892 RepID=UPI003D998AFA
MADTPKHSVSVAGIVVDDQDRVLVIQRRDNGHWEPPGGVLEVEEEPEEGARREVLEETGAEVEIERLTGVYKNMSRGIISIVFRARQIGGTLRPSDETEDLFWATLEEVRSKMDPAYSVRVEDAFRSAVEVRVHDGKRMLGSNG